MSELNFQTITNNRIPPPTIEPDLPEPEISDDPNQMCGETLLTLETRASQIDNLEIPLNYNSQRLSVADFFCQYLANNQNISFDEIQVHILSELRKLFPEDKALHLRDTPKAGNIWLWLQYNNQHCELANDFSETLLSRQTTGLWRQITMSLLDIETIIDSNKDSDLQVLRSLLDNNKDTYVCLSQALKLKFSPTDLENILSELKILIKTENQNTNNENITNPLPQSLYLSPEILEIINHQLVCRLELLTHAIHKNKKKVNQSFLSNPDSTQKITKLSNYFKTDAINTPAETLSVAPPLDLEDDTGSVSIANIGTEKINIDELGFTPPKINPIEKSTTQQKKSSDIFSRQLISKEIIPALGVDENQCWSKLLMAIGNEDVFIKYYQTLAPDYALKIPGFSPNTQTVLTPAEYKYLMTEPIGQEILRSCDIIVDEQTDQIILLQYQKNNLTKAEQKQYQNERIIMDNGIMKRNTHNHLGNKVRQWLKKLFR